MHAFHECMPVPICDMMSVHYVYTKLGVGYLLGKLLAMCQITGCCLPPKNQMLHTLNYCKSIAILVKINLDSN